MLARNPKINELLRPRNFITEGSAPAPPTSRGSLDWQSQIQLPKC